jgi:hypothetical protein
MTPPSRSELSNKVDPKNELALATLDAVPLRHQPSPIALRLVGSTVIPVAGREKFFACGVITPILEEESVLQE